MTYFAQAGRRVRRRRARRQGAGRRAVRRPGVGTALRHRARREQAVEQRDGAPALPHARRSQAPAPPATPEKSSRGRAPLARAAQAGRCRGSSWRTARASRATSASAPAGSPGCSPPPMRARCARSSRARSPWRRPTARWSVACATGRPPDAPCSRPGRSKACARSRATRSTRTGTRWIVVALVNDPSAARSNAALDFLAEWVIRNARPWNRRPALSDAPVLLARPPRRARIAEAMAEGAFDDLPGAGKPLALDDDTLVPEDLRVAYRILKNAGFLPPEVESRRETRRRRGAAARGRRRGRAASRRDAPRAPVGKAGSRRAAACRRSTAIAWPSGSPARPSPAEAATPGAGPGVARGATGGQTPGIGRWSLKYSTPRITR